ncbi:hypothetical protein SORBI_3005G093101 [Sorghum bicolor]|uniref:non-specific serine/threonine protein kinase n=1 Tax=Sorghum bicolor TaxID=4558 RepID=A0A1Z5RIQ4_SORBI|nr:hypothetical protein SORBI_3005G093101 [Sorghum bicolor]OQU83227.1 hypothetical protein SORBI_3005G093101 [Sorghum bicolor]
MNKRNRTSDNSPRKSNQISDNPRKLPYELIKSITNNFSQDQKLGCGSFGQVFKGVLEDGEEVAVKMVRFMGNINDQHFENEFDILKRLKHRNIVRLVGFCDEAEDVLVKYQGQIVVCQRIHRALCLEYMPNGSLGKLLSGENLGKNWRIRYKIIKGICKGLEYLQEGLEFPIFHFDLKPDNILLNEKMVPKISDFGSSRLIDEENTKKTLTPQGTLGYLPPEFIDYQVISKEHDIYSLGAIITKIVTGISGYSDVADMDAQESVEHVHGNWTKCVQEILRYASLEVDCKQVRRCIQIARRCMDHDRHKRPTIKDIVRQLNQHKRPPIKESPRMEKVYEPSTEYNGRRTPTPTPIPTSPPYEPSYSYIASFDSEPAMFMSPHLCHWQLPDGQDVDWDWDWDWDWDLDWEAAEQTGPEKQKRNVHSDPPSEIWHPTHPEHKLKLMTGLLFLCDGCKEPGYGPRYACDCGHTLDLHTRCALADDPLFCLHTLVRPLFGYGKQFEFRFLQEASSSPAEEEEGRRVCDACGEPTRGFVYHCSDQGLDLHPCCASLPDRIILDGRACDLHRRASRPCALCPENEGQRRWFWAYRCNLDGEEAAVDLHVACLKATARRSWETCYRNRNQDDVGGGGGALNVDSMLENMFTSTFGDIAGTLASFITALVFGSLIVKL